MTTNASRRLIAQTRWTSPLGGLLVARSADGIAGVWFDEQKHHPGSLDAPRRDDDPLLQAAIGELEACFAGREVTDELPLDLHGTPFQQTVWQALRGIARGQTLSYGELASRLGVPRAVRAVGAAVGRNPVSLLVPCHRVVGRDGSLTGYAGGLDRKRALLALEAAAAAAPRAATAHCTVRPVTLAAA
jgi:methylated-DNA-[protein]-cysteine S-methyltransferase